MSIIVTCREQQPELMRLLPELLSVQYSGDCEVIVVDEIHDRDMEKWLEEMEQHYPQLCHTFCSATARGINIRRLALTLGAKAANGLPFCQPIPSCLALTGCIPSRPAARATSTW